MLAASTAPFGLASTQSPKRSFRDLFRRFSSNIAVRRCRILEVRKGARPNDHDGSFLQQLADGPELLIRVTEDAGQHDQSATPAYLVEMRPDRIRTDHCPIGHPDSSLLDDIRSALHDICVHINCDASSKSAHSGASMQPVHLPKAAFDAKARRAGMLMYRFLFGGSSTYCKAGLSDQATTSDRRKLRYHQI